MARTRTSDPAYQKQRHAKPLVYACLLVLWAGLTLAAPPDPAPCVACQVLSVSPDQVGTLPASLSGLSVAIRVAPETSGGWSPALQALAGRGAIGGLHVVGVPGDRDPRLEGAFDLLIVEPTEPGDADQLAFALKRVMAAARGQRPRARLLVAAPAALADALRARGLAPYIDGFVGAPFSATRPDDLLAPLSTDALVVRLLPDGEGAAPIVAAATAMAAWFPDGLVPAPGRSLTCGTDRPIAAFVNPQTLDLVATSRSCPAPAIVTGDVAGVVAERLDIG